MGALIWAILNSPLGVAAVGTAVAWVVRKVRASDKAKRTVIDIADELFDVVEVLGRQQGWTGDEKWKHFAAMLFDAARAELGREPTGKEMAAIQSRIKRAAVLEKAPRVLGVPRASPPPLPAPKVAP